MGRVHLGKALAARLGTRLAGGRERTAAQAERKAQRQQQRQYLSAFFHGFTFPFDVGLLALASIINARAIFVKLKFQDLHFFFITNVFR